MLSRSRKISSLTGKSFQRVQLKHLPYDLGALEPVISGKIMEFHYSRHHRGYVNNLNQLMEQMHEAIATNNVIETIKLTQLIKFNGGGHYNHEFFWDSMCPPNESHRPETDSDLYKALEDTWGSFETF